MSEFVNGKELLSSKEAGARLGYTPDYIGKLAREGKIQGKKIAGSWFVDEDSLLLFINQMASAEEQRLTQLRTQRAEEYQSKNGHTPQRVRHTAVSLSGSRKQLIRARTLASTLALSVFVLSFALGSLYVTVKPLQKIAHSFEILFAPGEATFALGENTDVISFRRVVKNTTARMAFDIERAVRATPGTFLASVQTAFPFAYRGDIVQEVKTVPVFTGPEFSLQELHSVFLDVPIAIYFFSAVVFDSYVDVLYSSPRFLHTAFQTARTGTATALAWHAKISEHLASLWFDRTLIATELSSDILNAFQKTRTAYVRTGDVFVSYTHTFLNAYNDTLINGSARWATRLVHNTETKLHQTKDSITRMVPQWESRLFSLQRNIASAVRRSGSALIGASITSFDDFFSAGIQTTTRAVVQTVPWYELLKNSVLSLFTRVQHTMPGDVPVASEENGGEETPTVTERIINRTPTTVVRNVTEQVVVRGVSDEALTQRLQQLENALRSEISLFSARAERTGAGNYRAISQTNVINTLTNTTITNPTSSGGSFSDASFSGTFSGAISGGSGAFSTLTASDATTLASTLSAATTTLSGALTVSATATSSIAGQLGLSFAPTEAHTFGVWSTGVASSSAQNASLYINPASATADSNLIAVAVAGAPKFLVDAEGDLFANSLIASGGVTLATTSASVFTVEGDTTLGDAIGDTLTIIARLGSDLIPKTANTYDLGTTTLGFRSGFFNTSLLVGNTATTTIRGDNASSTFAGGIEASQQITAPFFQATSTTATSTFAGGLSAGLSNALSVLQGGRVGIGTAAPTVGLDVDVATDISGNLVLSGGSSFTISATGPINQTGTGQVTFAGNVNATNGLDVTVGNLTVGGANFTVAPATGNITGAGSLTLAGAVAASSTLQATGAARLYSTLQTDGTLTAAGTGTGFSVTNNASIGGTLNLTGAGTFGSTLAVSGALSAPSLSLTSGTLSLNSQKITGLANPTTAQDAANKTYVDSVAQGLSLKDSVRAGTTANITLSGEQTIDGVALVGGDRVLVKDQTDKTKNGIYVVASGAWSRLRAAP